MTKVPGLAHLIVKICSLVCTITSIDCDIQFFRIDKGCHYQESFEGRTSGEEFRWSKVKSHALTVSYDGNLTRPPKLTVYPGEELSCEITFIADNNSFHGQKVKIGVSFRTDFIVAGTAQETQTYPRGPPQRRKRDEECGVTAVGLYENGNRERVILNNYCSESEAPPYLETDAKNVTLFFHAYFLIYDGSSLSENFPRIFFTVDFTAFVQDCSVDKREDLMRCSESGRCIHSSAVCDKWGAFNCRSQSNPDDTSDQLDGEPSNCANTGETVPADLRPVWMTVGILAGGSLLTMSWWLYKLYLQPALIREPLPRRLTAMCAAVANTPRSALRRLADFARRLRQPNFGKPPTSERNDKGDAVEKRGEDGKDVSGDNVENTDDAVITATDV